MRSAFRKSSLLRLAGLALLIPAAGMLTASYPVPPRELRGRTGAQCRPNEPGPAFRLTVSGLKDRKGKLLLHRPIAVSPRFRSPTRRSCHRVAKAKRMRSQHLSHLGVSVQ